MKKNKHILWDKISRPHESLPLLYNLVIFVVSHSRALIGQQGETFF